MLSALHVAIECGWHQATSTLYASRDCCDLAKKILPLQDPDADVPCVTECGPICACWQSGLCQRSFMHNGIRAPLSVHHHTSKVQDLLFAHSMFNRGSIVFRLSFTPRNVVVTITSRRSCLVACSQHMLVLHCCQ